MFFVHTMGSNVVWFPKLFKRSSFEFNRGKKLTQVWNRFALFGGGSDKNCECDLKCDKKALVLLGLFVGLKNVVITY